MRLVLRSRTIRAALFSLLAAFLAMAQASSAAADDKYAAIVFDANSGKTLFADSADARRYPASLTKMMTLYVLFEELEAGRLSLNSRLDVSATAAAQAPSKLGLKAGSTIKVEDAILALTTKSANDVAVVVAENISGSISAFAGRMNRTARALGMRKTTFRNPHGLPNSGQVTTARDLVRLALALQDRFPTYYRYFGAKTFKYNGVRYRNHNHLLGSVAGVDGIKTGYTRASGFNLVTNVDRDGRHIVAVVMGGRTAASRDAHMRELIAKYLPAASRGARRTPLLVASAASIDPQQPRWRPNVEAATELAFAAGSATPDIVSAAMASAAPQGDGEDAAEIDPPAADPIAGRIIAATEVAALAVEQESEETVARLEAIAERRGEPADLVADAAARPDDLVAAEPGWHIQIGAVATEADAEALLDRAQDKMGKLLGSLHPFTQRIDHDGETLYRARFAGLAGKDAARQTCAQLKRRSIDCLAVPN
jgi:D-alanyl-D-alanine carboxypeptidase